MYISTFLYRLLHFTCNDGAIDDYLHHRLAPKGATKMVYKRTHNVNEVDNYVYI